MRIFIGLVPHLRFRIFRIGKGNKAGFLEDVEYGDPILVRRFYTDLGTGVFGKPVRQLPETFGKGSKAVLPILGKFVEIGNAI